MTGVALAVIIMTVSIAVVTGFKNDVAAKVSGVNSDIVLYYPDDYIYKPDELAAVAREAVPAGKVATLTRMTGLLKTPEQYQGLTFTGLHSDADTTFLHSSMVSGAITALLSKDEGTSPILVSSVTASAMGLKEGDKVDAYFVSGEEVRGRRYLVKGIFATHFSDFDRTTAFVPAESLPGVTESSPDGVATSIEISGLHLSEVDGAAQKLYEGLCDAYSSHSITSIPMIKDVREMGEMYFNWLALLDTNVVVILILMGVVAAFTLVSSLFIIILRKVEMIGILKALGATDSTISNIFIIVALRIVAMGLIIGDIVGLTLLWAQERLHFISLDPESYYLDYVPVCIGAKEVLLLNLGVVIVAYLVLVLPARLVTTISPASTMRYS